MDTAGPAPKPEPEIVADAAIEKVLHTLRQFAETAPITTVTLCFLAGVGAATLWNRTR
jgi:hypothetical protein